MADERERERSRDEVEQDGLGRDAAHGGSSEGLTGGSYGRSTSRAGDDDRSGQGAAGSAGGASIPRGTDEDAGDGDRNPTARPDRDTTDDGMDLDILPDVSRRDPTR